MSGALTGTVLFALFFLLRGIGFGATISAVPTTAQAYIADGTTSSRFARSRIDHVWSPRPSLSSIAASTMRSGDRPAVRLDPSFNAALGPIAQWQRPLRIGCSIPAAQSGSWSGRRRGAETIMRRC
jgi:hypothetical protein